MTIGWLILAVLGYLGILAFVASYAEKRAKKGDSLLAKPWMYSLSLAVYCTAWTFYGSVGRVVSSGIDFLTIYIGPLIGSILFWFVLKKIIRISKSQKISSLADFLSNRYGKSISLGALVALFSLIGVIPYIALQLKSISESILILTDQQNINLLGLGVDSGLVVALAIAIFTVWFGLRKIDLTEKHEGIIAAIALESVIKIVALVSVAIFAFWMLDERVGILANNSVIKQEPLDAFHWGSMIVLSLFAFFLLPRQWQVAVTENVRTEHLKKASWQFPLYLLIINICVIPIAIAGKLELSSVFNPDYYVLSLPLQNGQIALAFLAFFGGFAAASGMIVVSTISLATMLTNNILLPMVFRFKLLGETHKFIGYVGAIRRFAVFAIAGLAYVYYEFVAFNNSLVSIGLTSFLAVAQFAPATIGAIFWKKGNKRGAFWGIAIGSLVWFYMFILPGFIQADVLSMGLSNWLSKSGFANPENLFGIEMPSQVSGGLFWSLLFNTLVYLGISIFSAQNSMQLNQAELFVNADTYSSHLEENLFWRGSANNRDLKVLLKSFLGEKKSNQALRIYELRYNIGSTSDEEKADRRFVTYTENVLAGVIGSSSARIMVSSITSEQEIQREDVISILKESKEILDLNSQLKIKSNELKKATEGLQDANSLLIKQDEIKNEFLYTITHEIRTPITSIRAFTEILQDDEGISSEDRKRFIDIMSSELTRLSKLISQVLDLEKYESGKYTLQLEQASINTLIEESLMACNAVVAENKVKVEKHLQNSLPLLAVDKDKMKQVFINLITNAVKFSNGEIKVSSYFVDDAVRVNIKDNGVGIVKEERGQVFDKFYQIKKEAKGNGLGLTISKEIINLHAGAIWVDPEYTDGAKICISLPTKK
jgi:Na+/proline symporter/nitrogen-specific signal transduction histidine kinase